MKQLTYTLTLLIGLTFFSVTSFAQDAKIDRDALVDKWWKPAPNTYATSIKFTSSGAYYAKGAFGSGKWEWDEENNLKVKQGMMNYTYTIIELSNTGMTMSFQGKEFKYVPKEEAQSVGGDAAK